MSGKVWPDPLELPVPGRIEQQLAQFWTELLTLGVLVERGEYLLCGEQATLLRRIVLEMMLGLNGIAYPAGTHHLNTYLGQSQRAAIEKTLVAPSASADTWIAQAVSLVVIYRWYAPQLMARFDLEYPASTESAVLAQLEQLLPDWPQSITTD